MVKACFVFLWGRLFGPLGHRGQQIPGLGGQFSQLDKLPTEAWDLLAAMTKRAK